MSRSHCRPEGLPLPSGALDVIDINDSTVAYLKQTTGGATRGQVLLLHGLGQQYTAWADGTNWPVFLDMATWLRGQGWDTLAMPYPADLFSDQETAINSDFAGDPLLGLRYTNRLMAMWDHIKAYLIKKNNGRFLPTWCMGFSLGGWMTLQLLRLRPNDFVGGAAHCPLTEWSYLYNPLVDATHGGLACLTAGNVALSSGADIPLTALNGTTKKVWLGWGEGTEVAPILGWRSAGTSATAGGTLGGSDELIIDTGAGWVGGPNAQKLSTKLTIPKGHLSSTVPTATATTLLPVTTLPTDATGTQVCLVDGDTLNLYHVANGNTGFCYVSGNQTQTDVTANGGIIITSHKFGTAFNSSDWVTYPQCRIPVSTLPWEVSEYLNPSYLALYSPSTSNVLVLVSPQGSYNNTGQSPGQIQAAGYVTVDRYPTSYGDYEYTTSDYLVPDFGDNSEVGMIVDTVNFTGQNIRMSNTNPATLFGAFILTSGEPIYRNYAADGSVVLCAQGDSFVGWSHTKKIASNAAASLGAGGSISQHGYLYQDHLLQSYQTADIKSWVTATLNPVYTAKY